MTPEKIETAVERCLRCAAAMEWRHQTWQCAKCGLKLGCCQGEDLPAEVETTRTSLCLVARHADNRP